VRVLCKKHYSLQIYISHVMYPFFFSFFLSFFLRSEWSTSSGVVPKGVCYLSGLGKKLSALMTFKISYEQIIPTSFTSYETLFLVFLISSFEFIYYKPVTVCFIIHFMPFFSISKYLAVSHSLVSINLLDAFIW
jgi:hypothetical protein